MTTFDLTSPNTGDTLYNQAPLAQRILWKKGVEIWEQSTDFFAKLEGNSSSSLIWTETDTSKGDGQKIRFTNMSGFYAEPHIGEALFPTPQDFETIQIGEYELDVDFFRWATRFTQRMEEFMGVRNQIVRGLPDEIGKWLGRQKTEKLLMMFKLQLPAANLVYANGQTEATLGGSDTLSYNGIVTMGAQLAPLGGTSAKVGMVNGTEVMRNVVMATTDALFSLELDSNYRSILASTRDEAAAKILFSGGYTDIRGNIIAKYNPINHDGVGAIGSPLNAQALLGTAITAGTAAVVVTGGGSAGAGALTQILFYKYFDNYAYQFSESTTFVQDGNTHYLVIVNGPNDSVKPNGIGIYSYTTGNNGNQITTVANLGPVSVGTMVTTLGGGNGSGGVTWNTGPLSGRSTQHHDSGSRVFQGNQLGQLLGDSLMLMRGCAYRGYGMFRNQRSMQIHEGGFVKDMFVTSVFGQTPRLDRQGRAPAVLRQRHAITYAGVPSPVVAG